MGGAAGGAQPGPAVDTVPGGTAGGAQEGPSGGHGAGGADRARGGRGWWGTAGGIEMYPVNAAAQEWHRGGWNGGVLLRFRPERVGDWGGQQAWRGGR